MFECLIMFCLLEPNISFLKLQLLRPYDYKCPRLTELSAKSKQDKEYLDMAKQNKVSLIQTTRRVVRLDFRSTLGSQKLKLLVTPLTPPPKKGKNGLSFRYLMSLHKCLRQSVFSQLDCKRETMVNLHEAESQEE